MSPGSVVMFRSVRDGNKRSSVEQCPGTGGRGAPCTEAGDPAGRSRRPCRPCPRQVPLTNHPGTAAPTVAPREPGRTLGGTRAFRLALRPALESRTAPPWAVATRGMLGSPGGRAQASPRSHERPGLTHGPVSRTARSHARPWAYTRLGPIHTSSRCPPTSSGSASAGCLSIRSTARWPQRGGDLPAVSVRRRRGTREGGGGGTAGKTARPAACSAGLVGRQCVGGNAGTTFSASAAGRTRRRRGRPERRSSARPWWLDWPVQRIV